MARLIYSAITSLDGYVADADGRFDWAAPDDEVHTFINDHERRIGTYLYGSRMYETMKGWEALYGMADQARVVRDYAALWHAARKIVYSTSLEDVDTPLTTLERAFDPEAVRALKESSTEDLSVGGAQLAGQALAAGLVDEVRLFLTPVVVGGGTRALPDGVRTTLELLDARTFGNGVVHLHYRIPH